MSDAVPGVASSLLVQGTVVSQTNLRGDGVPELHPAVSRFFDALPPESKAPFLGRCAESALVSDQLWLIDSRRTDGLTTTLQEAADHFSGSAMVSKLIRESGDPRHGQKTTPCPACGALLDELGIRFLGP
ncbi:YwqJ-related putative deaminase [Actinacidiphila glaucinigra]|uniref:YwqJ-related putative deaminase n=1 Tax=Actinacidiphila glaucinigra TaxID=235986 RepID=UPI002DDC4E62|nr:YwqJ-related putative deaminase [Actinacidiphila glaucinigra]WSD61966.1 YwqJ-related putative deaminase [Actinacidiphila glaucinigra]